MMPPGIKEIAGIVGFMFAMASAASLIWLIFDGVNTKWRIVHTKMRATNG